MSPTLITTALIALVVGALVGMLLTRATQPKEKQRKELEAKLQKTEKELKDYQHEVTEHFIKTSALINTMTHSYRAVHEHLAGSAMHLANPDISRQLINAGTGKLEGSTEDDALSATPPEPPKDYAPKSPEGVLSENYGLKEDYGIETRSDVPTANDSDDDDTDPTLRAV